MKGKPVVEGRPGESLPPVDFDALTEKLKKEHGKCQLLILYFILAWRSSLFSYNLNDYFILFSKNGSSHRRSQFDSYLFYSPDNKISANTFLYDLSWP